MSKLEISITCIVFFLAYFRGTTINKSLKEDKRGKCFINTGSCMFSDLDIGIHVVCTVNCAYNNHGVLLPLETPAQFYSA